MVTTQLAQVEVQRQLRETHGQTLGNRQQVIQCRQNRGRSLGQTLTRSRQHFTAATQVDQRAQHIRQIGRQAFGQGNDLVDGFTLQRIEQLLLDFTGQTGSTGQPAVNAYMAEVHVHIRHVGQLQHGQHQADDFNVAARAAIAVQLGAQLDRAARGRQGTWLSMQHTAGIAQTAWTFATQGMRIDARHLRRDVGAKTHLPARLRVDDLEGTQIEVGARAGQQGFQVLDMGSHDKLVTPALEQIQHLTTRDFNTRSFRWQYFFDAIWQQPAVYRCHYAFPYIRAASPRPSLE
ncbi:hypothetical protein D3C81_1020690 [compost metagenome]